MTRVRAVCRLFLLCGCVWALASLATPNSLAQPRANASSSGRGGARAAERPLDRLLLQATAALGAKDFQTAGRLLAIAYPLDSGIVLYHLGVLAAAEQKSVEARDLWRRFLADPTVKAELPQRAEAQEQLRKLPIVDAGEISIGAPHGTQVQLDGRLVGTAPLAAPLLAATGRHRITVQKGRWNTETEVQVRTARLAEVRFQFGSDVAVVSLPAAVLHCDRTSDVAQGAEQGAVQSIEGAQSETLTAALEAAVKRENYVLLSRTTALTYAGDIAVCQGTWGEPCCVKLARRYGVDYVFDATISRTGANWQLNTALRDISIDEAAAKANLNCANCDVEKAAAWFGETATALLTQAVQRARGTLEVVSTPSGAEVWLNGHNVGLTPYQHAVWAGTYQVEVQKREFKPLQQRVEVDSDKPIRVQAKLEPIVQTAPASPSKPPGRGAGKRPVWRIVSGISAIGFAAVAIGFGAAGLATSGHCAVELPPGGGPCTRVYDTIGVGAGLLGAGSTVAVAGILLVAIPTRR